MSDGQKALHEVVVPQVLEEVDALDDDLGGLERLEALVKRLRGHESRVVYHVVGVQSALAEHDHHAADRQLRVRRRRQQRQHPAEAVADQSDLARVALLHHDADRLGNVLVDVGLERVLAVGRVGRLPVEQEHVEPLAHQVAQHAGVRQQVEDVALGDEAVDDQHSRRSGSARGTPCLASTPGPWGSAPSRAGWPR
jgi:hypothetical protein